ncbi:hypothetical protein A2U01_0005012, partial [Trifolium medium]|nr:hypothetical protein [Trifolium medium]
PDYYFGARPYRS